MHTFFCSSVSKYIEKQFLPILPFQSNPTWFILVVPFQFLTPFLTVNWLPSSVSLINCSVFLFVTSLFCPCPYAHVLFIPTWIVTPHIGFSLLLSLPNVCPLHPILSKTPVPHLLQVISLTKLWKPKRGCPSAPVWIPPDRVQSLISHPMPFTLQGCSDLSSSTVQGGTPRLTPSLFHPGSNTALWVTSLILTPCLRTKMFGKGRKQEGLQKSVINTLSSTASTL